MSGEAVPRALLVDDDASEGDSIANVLDDGVTLVCAAQRPAEGFEATVTALREALGDEGARVALLDYRLDDHELPEGAQTQFRGGTVAGFLRDVAPEIPIVLVTSDEKLRAWVETRPGVEEVFDWTLIKQEIVRRGRAADLRAQVADIALTWATLTVATENAAALWEELAGVLDADPRLLEPFSRLETNAPRPNVPGAVARWLLQRALAWDGPLVRDAQARAALGITAPSFELPEVQSWLGDARYAGPLQAFGRRWWAARLHGAVARAAGGTRPVEARARAAVIAEAAGVAVEAELCQWCRGERTVRACWLCGRPSDAAHAVRFLSDAPPAWAEARVACYSCIAEGRADEGVVFPPDAEDVVAELRSGRLVPTE
ncbi:MAG: hypothetical protein M3N16_00290 [Actinomycetota bacterium]|nr:hypothetical protein [Actinomycetota bacterium]